MVKVVLVLGAPGSGKGTLCKRLVQDDGLLRGGGGGGGGLEGPRPPAAARAAPVPRLRAAHISVGDMLRRLGAEGALSAEQARRTRDQELLGGRELAALLAGEMRDAQVRARAVRAEAEGEGEGGGKGQEEELVVVVDGFPRNMEQVEAFWEKMGHVDLIVSLRCPREVALERYLGRSDPTRPAGDEALFAKRFAQFEEENPKILQFYARENGGHTVEVNVGSTKGIDHNYETLKRTLTHFPSSPWWHGEQNWI